MDLYLYLYGLICIFIIQGPHIYLYIVLNPDVLLVIKRLTLAIPTRITQHGRYCSNTWNILCGHSEHVVRTP